MLQPQAQQPASPLHPTILGPRPCQLTSPTPKRMPLAGQPHEQPQTSPPPRPPPPGMRHMDSGSNCSHYHGISPHVIIRLDTTQHDCCPRPGRRLGGCCLGSCLEAATDLPSAGFRLHLFSLSCVIGVCWWRSSHRCVCNACHVVVIMSSPQGSQPWDAAWGPAWWDTGGSSSSSASWWQSSAEWQSSTEWAPSPPIDADTVARRMEELGLPPVPDTIFPDTRRWQGSQPWQN